MASILLQKVNPSSIPNPSSQKLALFINSMDQKLWYKNYTGATGPLSGEALYNMIVNAEEPDFETFDGEELIGLAQESTGKTLKLSLSQLKTIIGASGPFSGPLIFVTESRDFQTEDQDSFLVIGNDSDTVLLTFPNSNIFTGGSLYMYFITEGGYNTSYGTPIIFPLTKQTPGNDPDSFGQILSFTTFTDDVGSGLALIATTDGVVVDESDGLSKHTVKYLYDRSKSERIIHLGMITYVDVNSSPNTSNVQIPFGVDSIPAYWYIDTIYVYATHFNASSGGEIRSDMVDSIFAIINNLNDIAIENKPIVYSVAGYGQNNVGPITDISLKITFDVGGGEVNPQNQTGGSINAYALIKKFPFGG